MPIATGMERLVVFVCPHLLLTGDLDDTKNVLDMTSVGETLDSFL